MRRRSPVPLDVSDSDRAILERCIRRPKTAQTLAQRAHIILSCAERQSDGAVAAQLGVTRQTVGQVAASRSLRSRRVPPPEFLCQYANRAGRFPPARGAKWSSSTDA